MQNIERVDIDSIQPDPANSRLHGERNLAQIKASLERFGQQKPIVVDARNIVIAGNGQLAAAKSLGWTQIDIVRTQLTGTEAAAYAIADNRASEFAQWDDAALLATLEQLDEGLQGIAGFTTDEIASMAFTEMVEPQDDKSRHDTDKYEARVLKQIVLIYGLEQYDRVFDALAEYAEKHGLSDNSEVLVHLLEKNGHAVSTRA